MGIHGGEKRTSGSNAKCQKSVTAPDHEIADAATEGRPTHIPENSAFLS